MRDGGNKWLFNIGIIVDASKNLKWRLKWNQIFKVESTIGCFVKLEGLIGSEEVSKAAGDDEKHDWISSLHHNSSGDWSQEVHLCICADQ